MLGGSGVRAGVFVGLGMAWVLGDVLLGMGDVETCLGVDSGWRWFLGCVRAVIGIKPQTHCQITQTHSQTINPTPTGTV